MNNFPAVETLPVVSYQGVRVLTTELLAQSYGTEPIRIQQNYADNADRFIAGKHFFKLEGEDLKEFKRLGILGKNEDPSLKFTARLVLWTARGAARHAKILDTDQAWTVFEQLEETYFNQRPSAPLSPAEMIIAQGQAMLALEQAQARLLQKVEAQEQRQAEQDRKTEILENRVQNVELQHRHGVPVGYLSKKNAHHLYGEGLSEEIFHLAMAKVGVPIKNYIHRGEDGYESPTFAYLETEIQTAVDVLIEDAEQCSPQMCLSPMLGGKRFRFVKDAFFQPQPEARAH